MCIKCVYVCGVTRNENGNNASAFTLWMGLNRNQSAVECVCCRIHCSVTHTANHWAFCYYSRAVCMVALCVSFWSVQNAKTHLFIHCSIEDEPKFSGSLSISPSRRSTLHAHNRCAHLTQCFEHLFISQQIECWIQNHANYLVAFYKNVLHKH